MSDFLSTLGLALGGDGRQMQPGAPQPASSTPMGDMSSPMSVLAWLRGAGSGAGGGSGAARPIGPTGAVGVPGVGQSPGGAMMSGMGGGGVPQGAQISPWAAGITAGMAAQRPGQSAGGALLSGFGAALGGAGNAAFINQHSQLEAAQAGLEIQKKQLELAMAQQQYAQYQKLLQGTGGGAPGSNGYDPGYHGLGAGDGAPLPAAPPPGAGGPPPSGPGPSAGPVSGPATGGPPPPPPMTKGDPDTGGTTGAPTMAAPPQGGPGPQGAPPAPGPGGAGAPMNVPVSGGGPGPMPPSAPPQTQPVQVAPVRAQDPRFWTRVSPDYVPDYLQFQIEMAQRQLALAPPKSSFSSSLESKISDLEARRKAVLESGQVMMRDGTLAVIPGFGENKAAMEAQKTTAETLAKNALQPADLPNGAKAIPTGAGGGIPMAAPAPSPVSAAAAAAAPPLMGAQPQGGMMQPQASPPGAAPAPAQKPTFDPETGTLKTVIPPPPTDGLGGYSAAPVPPGYRQLGQTAVNQGLLDADKAAQTSAPQMVQAAEMTKDRAMNMAQALKMLQTGPGTETRADVANFARRNFGDIIPAEVIAGGDPAVVNWVEKEGVPMTFNLIRANMPAGSRINLAEFKVTHAQGVPNAEMTPQGNHQNLAETLGAANYVTQMNQDWQAAQKQGWQSRTAFENAWMQQNKPSDFVTAAQKQIGNLAGMPTPQPSDMVNGTTYVFDPNSMGPNMRQVYAKYGITQPGQIFRWNGKSKGPSPVNTANGGGWRGEAGSGR